MKLKQFQLPLGEGIVVNGAIEEAPTSGKAVVFSHGFGVKRDSRKMFTELGDLLKNNYLVVRFDYALVNARDNSTAVYPLSTQTTMLSAVLNYIRKEYNIRDISVVAHSLGCLVVGLLKPVGIQKIILNATPTQSPYGRMKRYFSQRKSTLINEKGISKLKRSDGSWTYIVPEFWPEVKDVNPQMLYSKLATVTALYLVRALQDQVIINGEYEKIKMIPNLEYVELKGSHDFDSEARKPWLWKMVEIINS